jgi:hypothetical protein
VTMGASRPLSLVTRNWLFGYNRILLFLSVPETSIQH